MMSLLLSLPDEHLPNVLSHLTLRDVLRVRLVCARFRQTVFQSTHHLWMDSAEDGEGEDTKLCKNMTEYGFCRFGENCHYSHSVDAALSARKTRMMLETFPHLRSMRLVGLRLTYEALVQGRNGSACSPRYLCSLLHEAECAHDLECLQLLDVSESRAIYRELGAAAGPSYSLHTDIRLGKLRKLTVEGRFAHFENPLANSLLRASPHLTHLALVGCIHWNDHHLMGAILKRLADTLVHLDLSESNVRLPKVQSATLETLILRRCRNLLSLDTDSFCPSLEVLDVSACPSFNGEGMLDGGSGLANVCPRLRRLNLHHCTGLKFVKVTFPTLDGERSSQSSAASKPTITATLEELDLSTCVHLSNATVWCQTLARIVLGECMHLKALSITAPALKSLDLSRLPLAEMSLRCASLETLNLAGCCDLDSKRSTVRCPALKFVDIRKATYITPEFFHDVSRKCDLTMRGNGQVLAPASFDDLTIYGPSFDDLTIYGP